MDFTTPFASVQTNYMHRVVMSKPCKNCGGIERTKDGHCKQCSYARKSAVRGAAWYVVNKEHVKALAAARYIANKAVILARNLAWSKENPEKRRAIDTACKKLHPENGRANTAKRRAKKLQATPAWADEFIIGEAYALALLRTKMLGFAWHVDHIVPLRSKMVCGLHVHTNLQVIPAAHNMSKGNRSWPDMP